MEKPNKTEKSDSSQSEESVQKAHAIILALDRTIRSTRLYSGNNPILLRHRTELVAQFQHHFETIGDVSLQVEPFQLMVGTEVVYENKNEHESFAFRLFNDGIRSLKFKVGLSETELLEFLGALAADLTKTAEDSDAVTQFWEKEFEHISYTVADLIVDETSGDEKSSEERADEVIDPKMKSYHGEANESDEDSYQMVANENLKVTLNMVSVGKMFENRIVLSEGELNSIQADIVECDKMERLALDFVDMVLAVLQEEKDKDEFIRTLDALGSVLDHNLMEGQIHIAAMLMEQVHLFPERPIQMAQQDPQVLSWTLKTLWPEARIQLLFQSLNNELKSQNDSIEKLVRNLDPSTLPLLLKFVPTIENATRRQMVCKGISQLHKGDIGIFTKMLASENPDIVRIGLEIVSSLKNERVIDLMAPFVQRQNRMFRKEAIELLRNYKSPKANKLLLGVLEDPSEDIRILALHSLETSSDKDIARQLMATINRSEFPQKTFRERKAYYASVAKIAKDDFIPFLQDLLETRGWFQKSESDDQYKLATYALALIGSPSALSALEKSAKSKNKVIRSLSESALRVLSNQQNQGKA